VKSFFATWNQYWKFLWLSTYLEMSLDPTRPKPSSDLNWIRGPPGSDPQVFLTQSKEIFLTWPDRKLKKLALLGFFEVNFPDPNKKLKTQPEQSKFYPNQVKKFCLNPTPHINLSLYFLNTKFERHPLSINICYIHFL